MKTIRSVLIAGLLLQTQAIVFVLGGYYYWDGGYWYPALGYDPNYVYDYDGPIYAYGNLLPDRVIAKCANSVTAKRVLL